LGKKKGIYKKFSFIEDIYWIYDCCSYDGNTLPGTKLTVLGGPRDFKGA